MIATYHRPKDVRQALELRKSGAIYLAGGTQVNRAPLDRKQPQAVIDLRGVISAGVARQGTDLVIGALTLLQDLVDSPDLHPALRDAAGFIPTRSVRNQASIGGNIAAGRSDSYLIPTLIALDAVCRTSEGEIPVEEYVAQNSQALILDILVPATVGCCTAVKESRSHLALPIVSAAVAVIRDDVEGKPSITGATVAVGCVARKTIRLTTVEEAIVDGRATDRASLEAAIRQALSPDGPYAPQSDILGTQEFKIYLNSVVIADAAMRCLEALS